MHRPKRHFCQTAHLERDSREEQQAYELCGGPALQTGEVEKHQKVQAGELDPHGSDVQATSWQRKHSERHVQHPP